VSEKGERVSEKGEGVSERGEGVARLIPSPCSIFFALAVSFVPFARLFGNAWYAV